MFPAISQRIDKDACRSVTEKLSQGRFVPAADLSEEELRTVSFAAVFLERPAHLFRIVDNEDLFSVMFTAKEREEVPEDIRKYFILLELHTGDTIGQSFEEAFQLWLQERIPVLFTHPDFPERVFVVEEDSIIRALTNSASS